MAFSSCWSWVSVEMCFCFPLPCLEKPGPVFSGSSTNPRVSVCTHLKAPSLVNKFLNLNNINIKPGCAAHGSSLGSLWGQGTMKTAPAVSLLLTVSPGFPFQVVPPLHGAALK